MPDEDKNFGRCLVLDFRKWWRHVKTIYSRTCTRCFILPKIKNLLWARPLLLNKKLFFHVVIVDSYVLVLIDSE